jgi:hypothetical protein
VRHQRAAELVDLAKQLLETGLDVAADLIEYEAAVLACRGVR